MKELKFNNQSNNLHLLIMIDHKLYKNQEHHKQLLIKQKYYNN